jgi:hypothetical protein
LRLLDENSGFRIQNSEWELVFLSQIHGKALWQDEASIGFCANKKREPGNGFALSDFHSLIPAA